MSKLRRRLRRKKRHEIEEASLPVSREERSIVIATPMQDDCKSVFATSLVHTVAYSLTNPNIRDVQLTFHNYGTTVLPMARQLLAMKSMELGATHILWIDSDMRFPADIIEHALRYDPEAIVGANCVSRRHPFRCTAQAAGGQELVTTENSTGLEKIERIGFGVIWTPIEVFRKIPPPWFFYEWLPDKWVFRGEDYGFCDKARAAGFELFVDHDLSKKIEHTGSFGYTPAMRAAVVGQQKHVRHDVPDTAQEG